MKPVLFATIIMGSGAFACVANAGGAGGSVGVGFTLAPGQARTSPGQVFNTARTANPTTALSPGQLYIQNKAADPTTAVVPGQTFNNFGRSKK